MIQVTSAEARNFGRLWTHNGVSIFMDEAHYQFAADFANAAIQSLLQLQQQQAHEEAKRKQIIIVQE